MWRIKVAVWALCMHATVYAQLIGGNAAFDVLVPRYRTRSQIVVYVSHFRYIDLMSSTGRDRTAAEVADHRKPSPIGTTQHHYALSAEFASPRGRLDHVVVVPGETSTYVFGANEDGDIIDFDPRAVVADVVDPASALSRLGYRVA